MASVVPLRVRLADAGTLIALFEADVARLRDVDERELLISFADHASLALDRALAVGDRELLAVLSDRERIARDLHDTVIQRLFAVGMQLQAVAITGGPELGERLRSSVEDVDSTIRDIRATIFELQTQGGTTLRGDLQALAREYVPILGYPRPCAPADRSTPSSPTCCASSCSRCSVRRSPTSPAMPTRPGSRWRWSSTGTRSA